MRQNLSISIDTQDRAGRIKKARLRAGFKTARAAAAALSIPYPTYAGHENGSRGIKDSELVSYANAFSVSVEWLAFGRRKSYVKSLLPIIDFFDQMSEMKHVNGRHGLLEIDAPFPVPEGVSVAVVPDDRFSPLYFKGEILLVTIEASPFNCIFKRSLVLIEKQVIGGKENFSIPGTILRAGEKSGTFDIQEPNGRVHLNVVILWVAEVVGVLKGPISLDPSIETDAAPVRGVR